MPVNQTALRAVAAGAAAGIGSAAVLMTMARSDGKTPWQPMNATSHWLHGPEAGDLRQADLRHTVTGALTHVAASGFWGGVYALIRHLTGGRGALPGARDALATAALAAVTDYAVMPRRLTPGWELVLPRYGVAAAFGGMALGFVAAECLTAPRRKKVR